MALHAKQPQYPPARSEAALEYHQYAWPLRADTARKTHGSHGTMMPSRDESSMNSWEARAFVEDTSSLAAGIWPPRAYPCSFCHREFRSAQALGGHMNVHRRDRARMRHSSPPPPPFCTPQNISLEPAATVIHKFQHGYLSSAGLNPSAACSDIYPNNEILPKSNIVQLPTALSFPALISPKSSTASKLAARYPSHMAASFPLRLDLLASEAASTFMLPEAEAINQLSVWPASAHDTGNRCRSSTAIDARINLDRAAENSLWSVPSSLTTSSSTSLLVLKAGTTVAPSMGANPCKRARHVNVPLVQLEDESPRKKCNVANNPDYPPYNQDISLKSCSKDYGIIIQAEPHKHETSNIKSDIHVDESMCVMQQERVKGACGRKCVDLELRLGQRPPYPPADHQTSATAPLWSQV